MRIFLYNIQEPPPNGVTQSGYDKKAGSIMRSEDLSIRILLVEDEKKLSRLLKNALEREGFEVEQSFDGNDALTKILNNNYHLIVLDIVLPKKSGFDLLKEIRQHLIDIPILVLSARSTLDDRISGLQIGADDYLVKPFDSGELLARIHAILRRTGVTPKYILKAADLELDVMNRTVKRAGKEIKLSPKEFSLLEFFLKNKNQILTRNRIAEQVWGYDFDTGTNFVDVYVSYLRDAIDKGFSKRLIGTVRGQGFILIDEEED